MDTYWIQYISDFAWVLVLATWFLMRGILFMPYPTSCHVPLKLTVSIERQTNNRRFMEPVVKSPFSAQC